MALRTLVDLCGLLGHRRDKQRLRPFNATWRTKCVRCQARLERSESGKWKAISDRAAELARPVYQATLDPFLATPSTERASKVSNGDHRPHPRFAEELVRAPVPRPDTRGGRPYYLARAEEARAMADAASEQRIKLIHLEMAARYFSLANYCLDEPAPLSAVG